MAKVFSLASWNVEHFKGDPSRVKRVVSYLNDPNGGNKPDIFALYEVEGAEVYSELVEQMPGYSFHITEGPQIQEILVGVKKTMTAFFTQKTEFKAGNTFLRPGALLSVHKDGEDYTVLFLHTKSSPNPVGLGLRDDMFTKAIEFRRKLEKKTETNKWESNYLFLGDLNTMGMNYPFQKAIDADLELKKLDKDAKRVRMVRLTKNAPKTWSNGSKSKIPPSDLDQVVASDNLTFKDFGGSSVSVRGWVEETTDSAQDQWIENYSDHALLYFEVHS
jgi:endonuclease/exonuclease/phosphatase family metal-dependent hydrolase